MSTGEMNPIELAVSLYGQGESAADIWTALVSSGVAQPDAEALVKSLILAVALIDQRKPAAEIWSALVADGTPPATAEALIRDLAEVYKAQKKQQQEEDDIASSGFCKRCYDESSPHSPGNVSSTNGTGTMFYGGDRPCSQCGSEVRVHWFTLFGLPIIPLGTYRYRAISGGGARTAFIARKTQMNSMQVTFHYMVTLMLVIALFMLGMAIRPSK